MKRSKMIQILYKALQQEHEPWVEAERALEVVEEAGMLPPSDDPQSHGDLQCPNCNWYQPYEWEPEESNFTIESGKLINEYTKTLGESPE